MKYTIGVIAAALAAGSALAFAPVAQAQQNPQHRQDQQRASQRRAPAPSLLRPGPQRTPLSPSSALGSIKSRGPVFYFPPPGRSPFPTGTLPPLPGIMPAYVHPPSYYGPPVYAAPPSYYYSGPPVQYFMLYGQLYAQDLTTGFIYPVS